jgi:Cu-Zn family superoxide dismutase
MNRTLTATILVLGLVGTAAAQDGEKASASFINDQGKSVGTATLTQTPNGVLISLDQAKFESAGGHYNPGKKQHGYQVKGGPHAGDMPNQFVGSEGTLKGDVLNPNVTLGSGDGTLFGGDGTALVLHAKTDDYKSQPSGDAGGRIACAVIRK